MIALLTANWFPLLIALGIGLATAWWLWGQSEEDDWADFEDSEADDDYAAAAAPISPGGNFANNIEAPAPKPASLLSPSGPRIAPATGAPDDLMLIRGIGPKLNETLTALGVTRFDQIAAWTQADIAEIDPYLEPFNGRIVREQWVEQARLLTTGDVAAFKAQFGKA